MAFDGIVTKKVVYELQSLVGYKIDKIYEPNKDTVILGLYGNFTNVALLSCISPNNYRIHITNNMIKNPNIAPNFCMLLRKHILGYKIKKIPYVQQKRRAGKTHNNFHTLYDAAMLSVTSYTKAGMRFAVFGGMALAFANLLVGLVYLVMKLIYWDRFNAGQAPLIIIVSLLGSILLAFMGFLGEYISAINMRMMKRPLVVEEERINFEPAGTGSADQD